MSSREPNIKQTKKGVVFKIGAFNGEKSGIIPLSCFAMRVSTRNGDRVTLKPTFKDGETYKYGETAWYTIEDLQELVLSLGDLCA